MRTKPFYAKRTQFSAEPLKVKCSYSRVLQRNNPCQPKNNEPNRTLYEPNTNPIGKRPKINANFCCGRDLQRITPLVSQNQRTQSNPKPTQYEPNLDDACNQRHLYGFLVRHAYNLEYNVLHSLAALLSTREFMNWTKSNYY